jgi:hypothetical protein
VIPYGNVGGWEVVLALVPTINLMVMAVVWKLTGKIRGELEGQTAHVTNAIENAQETIQTDLKNGIRHRVDEIADKVDNEVLPRLDKKRERLEAVESKVDKLSEKVSQT